MGISKSRNRAAAGTLALTAVAILFLLPASSASALTYTDACKNSLAFIRGCEPYGGDPPTMPATDWNPGGGNQTQTPSGVSLGGTIWNHKLSASPVLDPNSAAIISKAHSTQTLNGTLTSSSGSSDWSSAFYFAKSTDPVYRVRWWRYDSPDIGSGVNVRIPAKARPAQSCDGHMAVIDQSTGALPTWIEWNFSRALTTSSQSCPNGKNVSQYADYSTSPPTIWVAAGVKDLVWWGDGRACCANAGGFGSAFGQVRPQELQEGVIDHTFVTTLDCAGVGGVFPAFNHNAALCSDTTNEPKMGARFWLDYTDAQIDAMGFPIWKAAILKALHNYGAIAADTGGSGSFLNASNEGTEDYRVYGLTDPWSQFGVPTYTSSGNIHYVFNFAQGVDIWNHLHVLAPCVSQGTC